MQWLLRNKNRRVSRISPLLFVIVMEEATRNCRYMVPWDMLYADDLVISAETESQSIERFNAWNKDL